MDFPSAGTVLIGDKPTSGMNDQDQTELRREKIGFIFQSFQLLHTLTVQENIELPLLLAGKSGARDTALERLHWVEHDGLGSPYPYQLSGGHKPRPRDRRAQHQAPGERVRIA